MANCFFCRRPLPAGSRSEVCWDCMVGMAKRDELSQWLTDYASPQSDMLATPVYPMEMAVDGRTVTASFLVAGELKGKGLYLPAEAAVASSRLFQGKSVIWDHVIPTPDRHVGEVLNVWNDTQAVYGQYSVNNPDHRKVLRAFAETGYGGMSPRIQYAAMGATVREILDVESVDVVLSPSSATRILEASQTQAQPTASPSLMERARAFFSTPPLVQRQPTDPAPAEPAPSSQEVTDMDDAQFKALLAEFKAEIDKTIEAGNTAVQASVNERLEAQTAALSETNTAVAVLAKKQDDLANEEYRKKKMRDKMSAELPDTPDEALEGLVNLAYAGRADDETEEAMMSRVDTILAPMKAIAEAQKAALAAATPETPPAETPPAEQAPPPITIPAGTVLSGLMSQAPDATVPGADDALAQFAKAFDTPVATDEHGRPAVPAAANGSAPAA